MSCPHLSRLILRTQPPFPSPSLLVASISNPLLLLHRPCVSLCGSISLMTIQARTFQNYRKKARAKAIANSKPRVRIPPPLPKVYTPSPSTSPYPTQHLIRFLEQHGSKTRRQLCQIFGPKPDKKPQAKRKKSQPSHDQAAASSTILATPSSSSPTAGDDPTAINSRGARRTPVGPFADYTDPNSQHPRTRTKMNLTKILQGLVKAGRILSKPPPRAESADGQSHSDAEGQAGKKKKKRLGTSRESYVYEARDYSRSFNHLRPQLDFARKTRQIEEKKAQAAEAVAKKAARQARLAALAEGLTGQSTPLIARV